MAAYYFLHSYLFSIATILSLNCLGPAIHFKKCKIMCKNKKGSTRSKEKGVMTFNIWAIRIIISTDLPCYKRKCNYLAIYWEEKLCSPLIDIKIRRKGILNTSLYGNLILNKYYLICLKNGKFILRYFWYSNELIFWFHNVIVT